MDPQTTYWTKEEEKQIEIQLRQLQLTINIFKNQRLNFDFLVMIVLTDCKNWIFTFGSAVACTG